MVSLGPTYLLLISLTSPLSLSTAFHTSHTHLGGLWHGLGVPQQRPQRLHQEDHVVQLLLPVPQRLLLVTGVQQVERARRQQVGGQLGCEKVQQTRVLAREEGRGSQSQLHCRGESVEAGETDIAMCDECVCWRGKCMDWWDGCVCLWDDCVGWGGGTLWTGGMVM